MPDLVDGFWLPADIHQTLIDPETTFTLLAYTNGQPCAPETPCAVMARVPRLAPGQWPILLATLQRNRRRTPAGTEFWERLQQALPRAAQRLNDPADRLHNLALRCLPDYTGYSEAMIRFTLGALEYFSPSYLPSALRLSPTWQAATEWQAMPGLPGRLRFYPTSPTGRLLARLSITQQRKLFRPTPAPNLVLGYGAGNVPGTALMIGLLAQSVTLSGPQMPAVLIKNSRREPLFSPLIFSALEAEDPDLVCSLAVLVWDYADTDLQKYLLSQPELVIAAAGDETIAHLQTQAAQAGKARFHAHGHKASFSAIGSEVLAHGLVDPASGQLLVDIVALLAGLDSVFWDQNGCLSSRFHFVESGGVGYFSALEYAQRLEAQLRWLAQALPRGAWPRQWLHERFDRYKLLESAGQVQVLSQYQDDYLVVLDERPLTPAAFRQSVNECQGRVIVVRPVNDLMEIPTYLGWLPAGNLQSMSLAAGQPGQGLSEAVLDFAAACGERGVTAIRSVGRGAFPQLSHSWDGLIPLDLARRRPAGYFTTIEFDDLYGEILETFGGLMAAWKDFPGQPGIISRPDAANSLHVD